MQIFQFPKNANVLYGALVLISFIPTFLLSEISHLFYSSGYALIFAIFNFILLSIATISVYVIHYSNRSFSRNGLKLKSIKVLEPKWSYTFLMFLPAFHQNFVSFSDVSFGIFIYVSYFLILFCNEKFLQNHILHFLGFKMYEIETENTYIIAISLKGDLGGTVKTNKVTQNIAFMERDE